MKQIVLIGGSYGIGWALAQELMQQHQVYVASRTDEHLSGTAITHIPFDALSGELNPDKLPETIDGLVYCPGSINLRPFKNLKPEAFESDLQLNFIAMVKVLQTVMPRLLAAQHSSVVLFSSVAASTGMPFHTSVAAAKGAVEGFAKALAAEYAPKMRVNVIAPSLTETPLAHKFLDSESKIEKSTEKHPLKRIGKADDIAHMAAFLLSEKSSWVTGQVFAVDGGISTILTS